MHPIDRAIDAALPPRTRRPAKLAARVVFVLAAAAALVWAAALGAGT
jgi:hypothetical protein